MNASRLFIYLIVQDASNPTLLNSINPGNVSVCHSNLSPGAYEMRSMVVNKINNVTWSSYEIIITSI